MPDVESGAYVTDSKFLVHPIEMYTKNGQIRDEATIQWYLQSLPMHYSFSLLENAEGNADHQKVFEFGNGTKSVVITYAGYRKEYETRKYGSQYIIGPVGEKIQLNGPLPGEEGLAILY